MTRLDRQVLVHLMRILIMAASMAWCGAYAQQDSSPSSASPTSARGSLTSIAFYYAADVPWESLGAFDVAVVEPGHIKPLVTGPAWSHRLNPNTQVAAYISVGEVHPSRAYFSRMQPEWKLGENAAWKSIVVDQSAPTYAAFYIKEVIAPLWQEGYRAFFLDTLDSFYLVAKTPEAQAKQIAGMANLIREIKLAYPQARLIFNRGFEMLPQVHHLVDAVAAESLFRGFNKEKNEYTEVSAADRDWLWAQLKKSRDAYGLNVISIDYAPPEQRELARETAKKILALGAIPWVTHPDLNMLGVGSVEVIPRQVLAIHGEGGDAAKLALHPIHRMATLPLNALGLDADYVFSESERIQQLASKPLSGRYAGLLLWLDGSSAQTNVQVGKLLRLAREQGVPIVMVGDFPADANLAALGMQLAAQQNVSTPLRIEKLSPHVGFEIEPPAFVGAFTPLVAPEGQVWMRMHSPTKLYADAVAIMPWGGYAVSRYWWIQLGRGQGERWVVNPIAFFRAALRLDSKIPQPDVTTENGKRLLFVHHDGDGFASRAEIPGTPLAAEVMLSEFLQRYRIPTTVSVIEAETGDAGLYRAMSPQMEGIAKRMFALPHVEIATHSFSHPFFWSQLERGQTEGTSPLSLKIPNYEFNISREITGSAQYINDRLAPAGKRVRMMLWTGDTQPLAAPVREAYSAGLLNMNGGDTWINKAEPSLTLVAPLGMMKGDYFQVYAPNQNENVYTNDWKGPFYGYERVIETFEMTELPQRLKPINIYYHTYIASKRASIQSLHKVYAWATAQDAHPIYASEYALRVLDWRSATVAKDLRTGDLHMRSGSHLRQWRSNASAAFDAQRCQGIAGHTLHAAQHYLHAINSIASCAHSMPARGQFDINKLVLSSANAKLLTWQTDAQGLSAEFAGHVPFKASVQTHPNQNCELDTQRSSAGLSMQRSATMLHIAMTTARAPSGKTQLVLRCTR